MIQMNPNLFEFTSHYLAHIAINCFTNKYYEMTSPVIIQDPISGKMQNTEEVRLLSIFQTKTDPKNKLYKNNVYSPKGTNKILMVFNRTKITIWKEYFLRFDEGKRENMTIQMQAQEQKIRRHTAL